MIDKQSDFPNKQDKSSHVEIAQTHSISYVTKAVGVSARQLYYWESIGIVKPNYERFGFYSYRRYSQKDVDFLITIKLLLNDGYTLRTAVEKARERLKREIDKQISEKVV